MSAEASSAQIESHLTYQFTELEEYLQSQYHERSDSTDSEDETSPYRNLLALLQSVKSMSSGVELKDYIRSKREAIVQKQRSMSTSIMSSSSQEIDIPTSSKLMAEQDSQDDLAPPAKRIRTAQVNAMSRTNQNSSCDSDEFDPPALQSVILMGVSGSGKSSVGSAIAEQCDWHFVDGDDFHPKANRDKMKAGKGLSDEDRQGWLKRIRDELVAQQRAGNPTMVACSALKRKYRDYLLGHEQLKNGQGICIYLKISKAVSEERVAKRKGHFVGEKLVSSQFESLEEPSADEPVVVVDGEMDHDQVVSEVVNLLTQQVKR